MLFEHGYRGIQTISGHGDYVVRENSLVKTCGSLPLGTEVPKFVINQRGTRIVHREFLGDLISQGASLPYTVDKFEDINPVNRNLFPWLGPIAESYQQYKFNGLVVEFKSTSSEYAATSALGTVTISTNYNPNMPAYASKVAAESSEFAVSAKPSLSQIHSIECDPRERPTEYLFIQRDDNSAIPSDVIQNSDKRLTSFGSLQVATQGLNAAVNQTLGELWVSYDITLLKPVINNPAAITPSLTRFANRISTTAGSPPTTVLPYGNTPFVGNTEIPILQHSVVGNKNRFTFNFPGAYYMVHKLTGGGCAQTYTASLGATVSNYDSYSNNDDTGGRTEHYYVKSSGPGQYLEFGTNVATKPTTSSAITVFLGVADAVADVILALF